MPLSTGSNGYPVSAALLMDPKSMKQHMANGQARARLSSNQTGLHQTSPPRFDPRQLLNPKGYDPNQRRKDDEAHSSLPASPSALRSTTDSHATKFNAAHKRDQEEVERGMGSLIERVHNVSNREDRPHKKQKREHLGEDAEEEQRKAVFAGGGKGGDIGEYMKQKRREGQQDAGRTSTVVDLTAGDDDDVVVISDNGNKEVCYGRLESTKVSAHLVPTPSTKATYLTKSDWPLMKLQLQRFPGNTHIIRVLDPTGKDFGTVDVRTSLGLAPLMDSSTPKIRVQARLDIRKKKPGEIPGKPCSEYFNMTVNLYGPMRTATSIGKFLSQKQLWLRTPFGVDNGVEVCNPHAPKIAALPRTSLSTSSASPGSGTGYVIRTVEEIRNDVIGMFDSLEKSENLPEMEPDGRIITPLLGHQKQGLYFMTNKEKERVFSDKEEDNSSLWRLKFRPNGQRMFFNVITGKEERTKPPEVLGGILADMMGLGKTLTVLSLVVGSLDDAKHWANQKPPEPKSNEDTTLALNSKATLLVSPLSTIANWEEQINAHVMPGTLSYYIYHGNNRCTDVKELAKYDMVITTYSIVSSEFIGRSKKRDVSPLLQTNWFRIVLDEAHMIREQSTRQSQAICTLSAQRRWAVTGTPVQNRLDDLGALIKFLRVKPFDEKCGFTQFILSPFKSADPDILPKLRLLVDSFTLRRLKDRIDLPRRHDQIVRLDFNSEERVLYDWFAKDSDNKMKIIAGEQRKSLGGKTYVHILRAILRLRLICAHGKELLGEDDLKMTEGFSMNNAIDLEDEDDDKPAMTARQAYEMLILFKETDTDTCSQCARKIGPKETVSEDASNGKDEVIGYMLPCYQVVCRDCIADFKNSVNDKATVDNHFVCPFCDQYLRISYFELTQGGIEEAEEAKIMARENPRHAKIMGRYGGPHTKTKALIESLLQSRVESQANPGERPIKSVIFSGWTSHLDLIQVALEDNQIKYVRLDGRMTRVQRTAALDAFRDDPEVPVILVSIMAGGLGLNLTSGSKVYVMEPQFNPAAEAQAIDRIHRLGQKREVTTTRFIMRDSFEEKMLDLQRKKQNLADLSMGRGKLDKAEATKRRLEELRSLFK
ncbi:snf2 family domain-containing protein [Lasallia pustulata]|uniref:Snf2 family domain-containing protein n=1 Tax=Lasallia pustulata TaxID=136370 RepID=A0A1W5DDH2_9LECA|nr:snf2 family domain-containing protein [Lasallia pustulata]